MVIGIIISLWAILAIYLGMAIYFMNHFYFGYSINAINVSGKNVEVVNTQLASKLHTYALNIKERGGKNEQIKGEEVGLSYNSDGKFKDFKDKQNPYKWVGAVFNSKNSRMIEGVKYDKLLLKERLIKLSCFNSSNIVEPKNASFKYTDDGYVIESEVDGTKVSSDILHGYVAAAILKEETTIDLESINCYVKSQYTSKSQKTIDTLNSLNKYATSKVTYTFGKQKETLDASTINKWLTVDENLNVTFDEKEAKNYIDVLSISHNTIGATRNFITSKRKTITVGGGDYGWSINRIKETQALIAALKAGQTIAKEPEYIQTASSHSSNDIGNTYVEIDLTNQHLWF
ncbi:peptidoglycan binding domain-containing protein [Clostridium sp.]|jgi:hypothetical protein|uniref:peptidoglycan binding domain-containing protein n=1 Tax=Clostridium sp. TaxID=1506 RepID=UPI003EED4786